MRKPLAQEVAAQKLAEAAEEFAKMPAPYLKGEHQRWVEAKKKLLLAIAAYRRAETKNAP